MSAWVFPVRAADDAMPGGPATKKKGLTKRLALAIPEMFGRRDWTRTNDPHHVKVVL
jgi:hypothetical protein